MKGPEFLQFQIPMLSSLSDDEVEAKFPNRDGPWSRSSKALLQSFGTSKLEMDANWASTYPGWKCPSCNRTKPELVRLTKAGILLCRLDLHHDHLSDRMAKILSDEFGDKWPQSIPSGTHHIATLGTQLISRFKPILLCIDCNAADGEVKRRLGKIDTFFSFRASEIGQFIDARPNVAHQLHIDCADKIYTEQLPDFEQRMKLGDTLLSFIREGKIPQEANPFYLPNGLIMPTYLHSSALRNEHTSYARLRDDIEAFERRSVSRHAVASNVKSRTGDRSNLPAPSAQEVAAYDGGGSPFLWAKAAPDWQCSVCHRGKSAILRKSRNKSRKWSGKICEHTEYVFDGTDDHFWIDHHEDHLICSDCASIAVSVKQRHPNLSDDKVALQISDMRDCARFAPNSPHEIDAEKAVERVEASRSWATQRDEYMEHLRYVRAIKSELRSFTDHFHGDKQRAFDLMVSQLAERQQWPATEAHQHLVVSLEEADRILTY